MDKKMLDQVKEREMQILDMIDNFCQEHNIEYSLAAGSALGAVRHQGFIPWDDDMDITMTRKDFTKFYTEWNKAPVNGFYLQYFLWDHDVGINHAKMRMDNTVYLSQGEIETGHHGIWVDIFPVDKMPDDAFKSIKVVLNGICLIFLARADMSIRNLPYKKRIVKFAVGLIPKSLRWRMQKYCTESLIRSDSAINNDYHCVSMSTLDSIKNLYPGNMLCKTKKVKFENREYRLFANYDICLRILYGDYMELPPVEERKLKHSPAKVIV